MCADVTENVTESVGMYGDVTDNVTNEIGDVTENRLNIILELLKNNPMITMNELAERISVSRMTIYRTLETLKKIGKVVRFGGTRSGYWKVMETED